MCKSTVFYTTVLIWDLGCILLMLGRLMSIYSGLGVDIVLKGFAGFAHRCPKAQLHMTIGNRVMGDCLFGRPATSFSMESSRLPSWMKYNFK